VCWTGRCTTNQEGITERFLRDTFTMHLFDDAEQHACVGAALVCLVHDDGLVGYQPEPQALHPEIKPCHRTLLRTQTACECSGCTMCASYMMMADVRAWYICSSLF
jgi:hypothetical protein